MLETLSQLNILPRSLVAEKAELGLARTKAELRLAIWAKKTDSPAFNSFEGGQRTPGRMPCSAQPVRITRTMLLICRGQADGGDCVRQRGWATGGISARTYGAVRAVGDIAPITRNPSAR
jgi:hypothetical protein